MNEKTPHKDHPLFGMACAIGAFFMFAIMQTFAKILSETHHVAEIAFYRNAIAALPFLFIIFALKKRHITKINSRPKTVVARAIIGTISLIVTFAAYAHLPMADATAFLFTSSLMIPILGIFFLSEKVGLYRWGAIIIGFIGVLIMLKPSGDVHYIGVMFALGAACLHAILHIILRSLGKTEKPETVTFYFVTIGALTAAIPFPFFYTPVSMENIPLLIGVGLSGVIAQFLVSTAYKNAEATIVTVFNYSGIIWATLFGWMIWNDWPALTIWIGGTIVIASNLFILWRESRKGLVTGDRIRAKF